MQFNYVYVEMIDGLIFLLHINHASPKNSNLH